MTEKRFVRLSATRITDTKTGENHICYISLFNEITKICDENDKLKQQKPFLKIHNDYFIQYGDEGELFSLHKPSDIRSLMYLLNRENGYSELQCEYNDFEME